MDEIDLDAVFAMLSIVGFVMLGVQIHRVAGGFSLILESLIKKIMRR